MCSAKFAAKASCLPYRNFISNHLGVTPCEAVFLGTQERAATGVPANGRGRALLHNCPALRSVRVQLQLSAQRACGVCVICAQAHAGQQRRLDQGAHAWQ